MILKFEKFDLGVGWRIIEGGVWVGKRGRVLHN
jgi:hypothetical protein